MDRNRALQTLELEPDATADQIKVAYRDLAKVWHPDHYPVGSRLHHRAQAKLSEINRAYAVLRADDGGSAAPSGAYGPADTAGHRKRSKGEGGRFRVDQWVFAAAIVAMGVMGYFALGRIDAVLEPVKKMQRDDAERTSLVEELQKTLRPTPPKQATAAEAEAERRADAARGPGTIDISVRTDEGEALGAEPPAMPPRAETQGRRTFEIGSTKSDVLAIEGLPSKESDRVWSYGRSRVYFDKGVVTHWESDPSRPLQVAAPAVESPGSGS